MAKKPTEETTEAGAAPETPAAPLLKYEVLAKQLKIGGVIAYRTARVNLTKEDAEAINSNQPESVRFLGI